MKQLIYIGAGWCGPCQQLKPLIEQLSLKYSIVKIDADISPEVVNRYNVRNIPTILLIENGEAIRRLVGTQINEMSIIQMYNNK